MADEFVHVSDTYSDEHGWLFQADCDRCGWHTRQAEGLPGEAWCQRVAELHRSVCPANVSEGQPVQSNAGPTAPSDDAQSGPTTVDNDERWICRQPWPE